MNERNSPDISADKHWHVCTGVLHKLAVNSVDISVITVVVFNNMTFY